MHIWSRRIDAVGNAWYWGKFEESSATGWLRGDLIDVWADDIPPRL